MYTVQHVIAKSREMSLNPNLLSEAINAKSLIQTNAIANYGVFNPLSKFMTMEDNVLKEGKYYLVKTQKTDSDIFCVALAVGTILKELNDGDTSYVSNQSIANYMNELIK